MMRFFRWLSMRNRVIRMLKKENQRLSMQVVLQKIEIRSLEQRLAELTRISRT